jgi:hypothetical protein
MGIDEAAREIEEAGDVLGESFGTEEGGEAAEASEDKTDEGGSVGEKADEGEGEASKAEASKEEEKALPKGPEPSELAKLEAKIELLKERQPDVGGFYANLGEYLSDDEMALRFEDDQSAYIEAVERAKEKYLAEHSNGDEIKKLEAELAEKRKQAEVTSALSEVVAEFPDYDHKTISDFVMNDLSKREQDELYAGKKRFADIFKAAYKKWREKNPGEVETVHAPDIPDMGKARKQGAGERADRMFGDEEKAYLEAVGFAKR